MREAQHPRIARAHCLSLPRRGIPSVVGVAGSTDALTGRDAVDAPALLEAVGLRTGA